MAAFGKTIENVRKHRDSKPKYGEKVKISYIDTGSFIVYVKKKNKIFTKIVQKMLKQDLTLQMLK